MRPLTQSEIDNAPEWATHYLIVYDVVHYESNTHHTDTKMVAKQKPKPRAVSPIAHPIPRKEFAATAPDRACLDIFNDFDSIEVLKMAPSIAKAWEAGQNLKGKL